MASQDREKVIDSIKADLKNANITYTSLHTKVSMKEFLRLDGSLKIQDEHFIPLLIVDP
jgi:hypothetical protein